MPELKDLVQFALDKQPAKFKETFGDLLSQRVVDRVEELKAEISANMFGESPEDDDEDIDYDSESDDDDYVDDEDDSFVDDIELDDVELDDLIHFDDEDLDAEGFDDEGFDDEDMEEEVDLVDEDDESFLEEIVDAIKEDTNNTHWIDSRETRPKSGGGVTLGVKERTTGRISGYIHVGPKVDKSGKKSMFGSYHKMTYSQITKGATSGFGIDHDLGVRKFNQSDLENTVSIIHKAK